MSELVSAYPTAGGIYWWASKLGGAGWGWFTGWFNLIGLIAVDGVGRLRLRDLPEHASSALFDFNLFHGQRRPARRSCAGRSSCSS